MVLLLGPQLVTVGARRGDIRVSGQGLPLHCNGGECGSGNIFGADGIGEFGRGYGLVRVDGSSAF